MACEGTWNAFGLAGVAGFLTLVCLLVGLYVGSC